MSTSDESKPVPVPESTPRILLSAWLNATRILAFGSILPWGGLAFCSLISYPSDEWSFSRVLFLGTFYSYPLIIIGIVWFARFAYKKGWDWVAWITSALSIVPLFWFVLDLIVNGI